MPYYHPKGTPQITDVINEWQNWGKIYDDDMPLFYDPEELWPYREYTRSRDDGRRSPEEWDELFASMQQHGWDPKSPAHVKVGRNGKAVVGEGNHRLAIAMQLGLKVPVFFHFVPQV